MKKLASLFLSACFALGLAGCASSSETVAVEGVVDDSEYTLRATDVQTPVVGNGAPIALVVDNHGLSDGANNAAAWSGVQKFCQNFGFTAQSLIVENDSEEAAETTLRTAAEGGAAVVVCVGEAFETPLYNIQKNYPSVSYLMIDGEPHTEDYSSYATAESTHCVLFREEQAGYLAGYAAVEEGYTSLGFLGAETMPDIVRYGAGFLQGAEAAAEQSGAQVSVKYWYGDTYEANDDIVTRMSGWYADGTQAVFACGGTLAQSCADAAEANGGRVIASDHNQSALGTTVLTSAIKCVSRTVQDQLYDFYANGGKWRSEDAGQTEQAGVSAQAVGLSTAQWSFLNFTKEQYDSLYGKLRSGTLKAERYSDSATMPETQNVAVDYQD